MLGTAGGGSGGVVTYGEDTIKITFVTMVREQWNAMDIGMNVL